MATREFTIENKQVCQVTWLECHISLLLFEGFSKNKSLFSLSTFILYNVDILTRRAGFSTFKTWRLHDISGDTLGSSPWTCPSRVVFSNIMLTYCQLLVGSRLVGVCLLVLFCSGFCTADVFDSHSFRSVIARRLLNNSFVAESVFHAALPPSVTIVFFFLTKTHTKDEFLVVVPA